MSSSCRNLTPLAPRLKAFGFAFALAAGAAHGADTYVQPSVDLRVEQNTNRNLSSDPATEDDLTGYIGNVELLWGYRTPTNDTRLRPRLRFQYYPDREDIQRSEQFLDFTTRNRVTERTAWNLDTRYSRRDAFNAELGGVGFDDLDPDELDEFEDVDREDPAGGVDPGQALTDETRTRFVIAPGFSHRFTERTGIDLGSAWRTVRFSEEIGANRRDYDYLEVSGTVTQRLDPHTRVSFGPYASRFETRDDLNTTDSLGLILGWDRAWSERWETRTRLQVERAEVELSEPGGFVTSDERDTDFGGEFSGLYRTETGRLRFSVGRFFLPTTSGTRSAANEIRAQYDWNQSERLSFVTAVRAYQREAQGRRSSGSDQDFARAEFGARWMMTPTMFIGGGYEYTWRDRASDPGDADNHAVYISFGYRGLGPQTF
jgi:hypothetical protein